MPSTTMLVSAAYSSPDDAEEVVRELGAAGFKDGAISLVYTDTAHVTEHGLKSGLVFGGVVGGLVGLLFPPAGVIVAAGPILGSIASALTTGAVYGAATGAFSTITAALVNWGMPQEQADRFGEHIHKGDAVVMVHTDEDQHDVALAILNRHHPRQPEGADPAVAMKMGAT